MTVTSRDYTEDKKNFFEKHDYDYSVETSPMNQYGEYSKVYSFADGAAWCEHMSPYYATEEIEVKLVKVTVDVKLFRTEYWSTEAPSKYYYERF